LECCTCRYCTVEFGKSSADIRDKKIRTTRLKTATRKKNLNPAWEDTPLQCDLGGSSVMVVTLWDHKRMGKDVQIHTFFVKVSVRVRVPACPRARLLPCCRAAVLPCCRAVYRVGLLTWARRR